MRKLLIVAILGLFGLSAQGLSHQKAAKLRGNNPTSSTKDIETEIAANLIDDSDKNLNLGLNGVVGYENEHEKSDSESFAYSKEEHHDSQKIDISINFNVGENGCEKSCESDSDSGCYCDDSNSEECDSDECHRGYKKKGYGKKGHGKKKNHNKKHHKKPCKKNNKKRGGFW